MSTPLPAALAGIIAANKNPSLVQIAQHNPEREKIYVLINLLGHKEKVLFGTPCKIRRQRSEEFGYLHDNHFREVGKLVKRKSAGPLASQSQLFSRQNRHA